MISTVSAAAVVSAFSADACLAQPAGTAVNSNNTRSPAVRYLILFKFFLRSEVSGTAECSSPSPFPHLHLYSAFCRFLSIISQARHEILPAF